MLHVPASMPSPIPLGYRQHFIHWHPPLRHLLKPLINQSLQTGFLIVVNVAPRGPFTYPYIASPLLPVSAVWLPTLRSRGNIPSEYDIN
jgi:hypothetical protein